MTLRYTRRALRHLHRIAAYLNERSPVAARHVGQRIRGTAELLADFPDLGHDGALPGTRELVVPGLPYIIVHRVEPDRRVTILGIHHGAQVRPGQGETGVS